jgi:hypothetical protein
MTRNKQAVDTIKSSGVKRRLFLDSLMKTAKLNDALNKQKTFESWLSQGSRAAVK